MLTGDGRWMKTTALWAALCAWTVWVTQVIHQVVTHHPLDGDVVTVVTGALIAATCGILSARPAREDPPATAWARQPTIRLPHVARVPAGTVYRG